MTFKIWWIMQAALQLNKIWQFVRWPAAHKTVSSVHFQHRVRSSYLPPVWASLMGDKQYLIIAWIWISWLLVSTSISRLMGISFLETFLPHSWLIFPWDRLSIFLIDLYVQFIYVGYYFLVFYSCDKYFLLSLSLVFWLRVVLHHFDDTFMWSNLSVTIET